MKIEIVIERTAREALAILVDLAQELLGTLRTQNQLLRDLRLQLPQEEAEHTEQFDPDETLKLRRVPR